MTAAPGDDELRVRRHLIRRGVHPGAVPREPAVLAQPPTVQESATDTADQEDAGGTCAHQLRTSVVRLIVASVVVGLIEAVARGVLG